MDTTCRHNHINLIQCRFAKLGQKVFVNKSYSLRKNECLMDKLKVVHYLLNILRCYKTFDAEVTYAFKFVISRTDTASITIEINAGAETFTYTGTGDANDIVSWFKSNINDSTQSPIDYSAEIDAGVLYIYTTDTSASYSDTATISITNQQSGGTNSVSVTSLQNNEDEITDVWNCLSSDQLCTIINSLYYLLDEECN